MNTRIEKHLKNNRGRVTLSVLLVVSILVATGALYYVTEHSGADAAAITLASDTLNNSAPSATSNHAIAFTLPTALSASDTLTITFDSLFTTSSGLDFNDMDLTDGGAEETLGNVSNATTWGATTSGDIVITFTADGSGSAAGATMTIEIGDNALAGATGDSYITNPTKVTATGTADIYTVSVGGTSDSGDMLIAIIEAVTVSVTVAESLTFAIAGQTAAQCADYSNTSTSTEVTTTPTTVPFGTPSTNDFIDGCQELTVSTNASSGYVITVQEDDQLTSGSNQISDGNCDGACTDSAEATWTLIANNGFAYCMEDLTANGAVTADAGWGTNGCDDALTFFKTIADTGASETPQNIMQSTSTTANDVADIGYRLSVPGDQAAGTYTNILTFIATPTF